MASSLATPTARTHANSVSASAGTLSERLDGISAKSARARITTNTAAVTEEKRTGRQLVRDVMALLRRSQKAFALEAACPESDLSNALQDKQRFDIDWLLDQDNEFLLAWIEAVESSRQLTRRARMATKRAAAIRAIDLILDLTYEDEATA